MGWQAHAGAARLECHSGSTRQRHDRCSWHGRHPAPLFVRAVRRRCAKRGRVRERWHPGGCRLCWRQPDSSPQSCGAGARRWPRARRGLGGWKPVHCAPNPDPGRSDKASRRRGAGRAHRASPRTRRAEPARRRLRPDGRVVGTGRTNGGSWRKSCVAKTTSSSSRTWPFRRRIG